MNVNTIDNKMLNHIKVEFEIIELFSNNEIIKEINDKSDENNIVFIREIKKILKDKNDKPEYHYTIFKDIENENIVRVAIKSYKSTIDIEDIENESRYNIEFKLLINNDKVEYHRTYISILEIINNNYILRRTYNESSLNVTYECLLSKWQYDFSFYESHPINIYNTKKHNWNLFSENELYLNYADKNVKSQELYNPVFERIEFIHKIYNKDDNVINDIIIDKMLNRIELSKEEIDLININHDVDLSCLNKIITIDNNKNNHGNRLL